MELATIKTRCRIEDSSEIAVTIDAKEGQSDEDRALEICEDLASGQNHVLGCTVQAQAGNVAILAFVSRLKKNTEYSLPKSVANALVGAGLADEVKPAPAD